MRKMPAGQWVAWEGYDKIHDCNKIPARNHYQSNSVKDQDAKSGFEDLDFEDIELITSKGNTNGKVLDDANVNKETGFQDLEFKNFELASTKIKAKFKTAQARPKSYDPNKQKAEYRGNQQPQIITRQPSQSKSRKDYEWLKSLLIWVLFFAILIFSPYVCHKILDH